LRIAPTRKQYRVQKTIPTYCAGQRAQPNDIVKGKREAEQDERDVAAQNGQRELDVYAECVNVARLECRNKK
jgi:hypothetical protein